MILTGVWLALLDAIFLVPMWTHDAAAGDWLIRYTVRLALLFYAVAVLLMLWPRRDDGAVRLLARDAWSLAWLAYLVHLVFAMKFAHHWSHAEAVRHTQERSGFGAGIWFSHFFTLVWTLDVGWWWLSPVSYARRPAWISWPLHAYMAFIIFCGTVVYETGFIRWAGVVMFALLSAAVLYRVLAGRNQKCAASLGEGPSPSAVRLDADS